MSWYSADSTLVQFSESDTSAVSSEDTSATISQLLPDTEYDLRVSAVTEYGRGAEVVVSTTTAPAYDRELYQMRPSCSSSRLSFPITANPNSVGLKGVQISECVGN